MATKPMKKVKRYDGGGNVVTRSDDVIGDTNLRTGVYTPGSFDKNRAAGEENLNAVRGLWNRITGGSSDDSGTGTRGIKASVSDTKYEPTKSPVADLIGKSTEPKSSEDSSSGSYKGEFKPSKDTSSVGDSNFGAKKYSASSDTSDRKGETTITGKQVDKENTSSYEEAKPPKKTATDTNKEVKKAKADTNKEVKKSEDTNPVSKNFGTLVNPYQQNKTETKSTDTKKADTKPVETKKTETKKTAYYRGADGKMHEKTPDAPPKSEYEWGTQNISRNIKNAPSDIMGGLKKIGSALSNFETPAERRSREAKEAKNKSSMKSGGAVKKMASGGSVKSSASSRGDGIASRGKTRGKIY